MNPAAVVVGMCLAISVLVTALCAWIAHNADRRRVVAEEEAAELLRLLEDERRQASNVRRHASEDRAAGGEAVLWTEWSGWTGWLAAQTVVDGHRIRVWIN